MNLVLRYSPQIEMWMLEIVFDRKTKALVWRPMGFPCSKYKSELLRLGKQLSKKHGIPLTVSTKKNGNEVLKKFFDLPT